MNAPGNRHAFMGIRVQRSKNLGRPLLKEEDAPNLSTRNFLNMPVNDAESLRSRQPNHMAKGLGEGGNLILLKAHWYYLTNGSNRSILRTTLLRVGDSTDHGWVPGREQVLDCRHGQAARPPLKGY